MVASMTDRPESRIAVCLDTLSLDQIEQLIIEMKEKLDARDPFHTGESDIDCLMGKAVTLREASKHFPQGAWQRDHFLCLTDHNGAWRLAVVARPDPAVTPANGADAVIGELCVLSLNDMRDRIDRLSDKHNWWKPIRLEQEIEHRGKTFRVTVFESSEESDELNFQVHALNGDRWQLMGNTLDDFRRHGLQTEINRLKDDLLSRRQARMENDAPEATFSP